MSAQRSYDEAGIALAGLTATFVVTVAWWGLALWPVADAPNWLTRTRLACFGVSDTGLPDAGGWIGLIAGPAGMLAIIFVGWGRGVRQLFQRMRQSVLIRLALIALLIGNVLVVAGAGVRIHGARAAIIPRDERSATPPSTYPSLDEPAPPLALTDQNGARFTLDRVRGRPVLLTFAYAHCQTVCPVIVHDVLAAQSALAGTLNKPAVVVVTLDPWRDTPARLATMTREWQMPSQDAWMLSGSIRDVSKTLATWKVPIRRDDKTGEVFHPALVYVIDRQGKIAFATTGGTPTLIALTRRLSGKD